MSNTPNACAHCACDIEPFMDTRQYSCGCHACQQCFDDIQTEDHLTPKCPDHNSPVQVYASERHVYQDL